ERWEALTPREAVAGNNDPPELVARFGRRKIVPVDGVRLGLVHGDGPRGTTIDRSVSAFAEESVDVICFGHSHQPLCERRAGLWPGNPGPATRRRAPPAHPDPNPQNARRRRTPPPPVLRAPPPPPP